MKIEVNQLPPAEYSLNWRGHWRKRYQAGRTYQATVFYEAVDRRIIVERVHWKPGSPPFKKARLDLTFIFPDHRTRDEDNLRARFKPGQDALVDAHLIESDDPSRLQMGAIKVEVDRERAPMTIIELTEG